MKFGSRNTPGLGVVAIVAAIALGLVGTAVAGPQVAAKLTKSKVKAIATTRAKAVVAAEAPTLSVAHAKTADSATSAGSAKVAETAKVAGTAKQAETVGGARIVPINVRSASVLNEKIAELGELSLHMSCVGGVESLSARTTTNGNEISVVSNDANATDGVATEIRGQKNNGFNQGVVVDLGPDGGGADNRVYTLNYTALSGHNVSAQFATENGLGDLTCVVTGHAIVN